MLEGKLRKKEKYYCSKDENDNNNINFIFLAIINGLVVLFAIIITLFVTKINRWLNNAPFIV